MRQTRPIVVFLGVVAVLGGVAGADVDGGNRRAPSDRDMHAALRRPELSALSRSNPGTGASAADASDRVIAPPPAVFDGPPPSSVPPPAALADHAATPIVAAGGTWAVIIGIDDYPGTRSDLRSAVADASDVDAALARYGVPPEHRLVLTNGEAQAATIEAALGWLVAHAAPDATAVLFYAGHVRKLDDDTEAIVGADGHLVRDTEVASGLTGLQAHRAWIGIAACYGGGFTEALEPGRILTAATDADSLAYENAAYGRSYFVEYMVRRAMIGGAADGSVEQAYAWAADNLARDHPDRVPFQVDHAEGELVLGVASTPPPSAPPPPADAPPAEPPADPPPADDESTPDDDCVVRLGSLVGCPDR